MTTYKIFIVVGAFIVTQLVVGCGNNEADKERARLKLEEQARRETEAGNKAITDLNRRMFGKKAIPSGEKESPKADGKSPAQSGLKP